MQGDADDVQEPLDVVRLREEDVAAGALGGAACGRKIQRCQAMNENVPRVWM